MAETKKKVEPKWDLVCDKFEEMVKGGKEYKDILKECNIKSKSTFMRWKNKIQEKNEDFYTVPGYKVGVKGTVKHLNPYYNEKQGIIIGKRFIPEQFKPTDEFIVKVEGNSIILTKKPEGEGPEEL